MMKALRWAGLLAIVLAALAFAPGAAACGGLFCQNIPVDQQAERIIFTVNTDGTISAYVQINYTGSAPDFSWVVPVPSTPKVDVAEKASFDELSNLTNPIFMPPLMPPCAPIPMMAAAGNGPDENGVTVLASGIAGPYAYDVVTSPQGNELITWLRRNNYRVTEAMEPLIKVYVDEGKVFLAMKLRPDKGAQDIQPVKMTYIGREPMIPLRLTAVAANPNMNVLTWIFADSQAVSSNYAHPTILDENLRGTFFTPGGTNYIQLVDQTVALYQQRAFITEYAKPTAELAKAASDPLVKHLATDYPYVTRFFGRISPEQMTVDPEFKFADDLPDVSNVHDLSQADPDVFWGCKDSDKPISIQYDPNVVPPDFK
jgi:hypothetical protein